MPMNLFRAIRVYRMSIVYPHSETNPTKNEFNTKYALVEGEHILYDDTAEAWLAGERAAGRDPVEAVKKRWAELQAEAEQSADGKEDAAKKKEKTEGSAEDASEENADEKEAGSVLAGIGWGVGCLP